MEMRNIRYFLVVAEEENFRRAAERLHVAQSALSRRIQDLERETGFSLFRRERKRIYVTEAGRTFAAHLRTALEGINQAKEYGRLVSNGVSGNLRIGFQAPAVHQPAIHESFRRFRDQYPLMNLDLVPMYAREQLDALTQGKIDAGYFYGLAAKKLTSADVAARRGLGSLVVGMSDWVIAFPRHHPLTRKKRLRLSDLVDERFIWFPRERSPTLFDTVISACVAGGLQPQIVQYVPNEQSQLGLVAAGMGVTFANSLLVNHPPAHVILKAVDDFSAPIRTELIWRKDNGSPSLAGYVKIVHRMVGQRA